MLILLLAISRWCRFSCRTRSPPKFELLILILSLSRSLAWCCFFYFATFSAWNLHCLYWLSFQVLPSVWLPFLSSLFLCRFLLSASFFWARGLSALQRSLLLSVCWRCLSSRWMWGLFRIHHHPVVCVCSVPVKTICEVWLRSTILWAGEFKELFLKLFAISILVAIR